MVTLLSNGLRPRNIRAYIRDARYCSVGFTLEHSANLMDVFFLPTARLPKKNEKKKNQLIPSSIIFLYLPCESINHSVSVGRTLSELLTDRCKVRGPYYRRSFIIEYNYSSQYNWLGISLINIKMLLFFSIFCEIMINPYLRISKLDSCDLRTSGSRWERSVSFPGCRPAWRTASAVRRDRFPCFSPPTANTLIITRSESRRRY